jgi:hypothetical protein
VTFAHNVIDAAPPDTPIDVRVSMSVMKGVKVYVNYRPEGESDFTPVLMKRRGREKVARIPGEAVSGKALQYYIEARDANGKVVKSSGSASDPNVIMVDPSAPPVLLASAEERPERGEREGEAEGPRKHRNLDEEAAPMTGEQPVHKKQERSKRPSGMLWAGISLAGVGVLGGLAVGISTGILAQQRADTISADSRQGGLQFNATQCSTPPCSDRPTEQQGQMYNALAISGYVVGGVLAATGVGLIIADRMRARNAAEQPRRRAPAPREEEPAASSWYVAPAVGTTFAGAGGGFTF